MTDKPRINENAVKRKLHPSSGIAVDIEYIEKTLTKTWSLNRMEASRYTKRMRDNTYVWLTDLVQEVKELREVKCEAESLIQQKDAEIERLKKSIEGLRLITERSTRVQPEHTSFLRDKGDNL
ncbi:hypothetical protein [Paenibacillus polymyxa]|uniref:hypothetical protein n=1 Tax=Paenibacillus polymyxa TaxID=1406 RepID=UPI000375BC2A|nr:hypothetical protein [Paenibacillus polymyxa]NMP10559.1 hypothetical protein [Paenibacillus polymyxa]